MNEATGGAPAAAKGRRRREAIQRDVDDGPYTVAVLLAVPQEVALPGGNQRRGHLKLCCHLP